MAASGLGQRSVRGSGGDNSWMEGLEPVEIRVTPAALDKLTRIAKESRMSVSQLGSAIFQKQLEKYEKLEESIEEAVSKSMVKNMTGLRRM